MAQKLTWVREMLNKRRNYKPVTVDDLSPLSI